MSTRSPLGEVPYLPVLYQCSRGVEHRRCQSCKPLRSERKTALMMTLTAIQHGVLRTIAQNPRRHIDHQLLGWAQQLIIKNAGKIDLVRAAVAAGQLEQRGLLRYERDLSKPDRLLWSVTPEGEKFLD